MWREGIPGGRSAVGRRRCLEERPGSGEGMEFGVMEEVASLEPERHRPSPEPLLLTVGLCGSCLTCLSLRSCGEWDIIFTPEGWEN